MSPPDARTVLAGLLRTAGLGEPALPSSFATGTAAQATVAASALAAAELWRLRTGKRQHVSVDMRHAAIEFRSERYLQIDGKPYEEYHDDIAGLYRCGDGRWVRLHTNLPHHCSGLLALLQCPHDKAAVQRALDGWQGEALETAAAEAGLVVTACHLPSLFPLVVDTGRGKLSTSLDLREPGAREALAALARDADIFVQGY